MIRKETHDFLIRNMPLELYDMLQDSAHQHRRSKNQEAIVLIKTALGEKGAVPHMDKPTPMRWKRRHSAAEIQKMIEEGRE